MQKRRFATIILATAAVVSPVAVKANDGPIDDRGGIFAAAHEPDTSIPNYGGKLLVREILRQAVLIAVRDELGYRTRDMALRESHPDVARDDNTTLDITTSETLGQQVTLRVRLGTGADAITVYEKRIPVSLIKGRVLDYAPLVSTVEELSRTEIPEALRKAGLNSAAKPAKSTATVPTETSKQIDEMNFFSQFATLRELHALHEQAGTSPESLGALVRAYSNLGQLCSFHGNGSYKAFRARALLYAERMVEVDGASYGSLLHRAYARAFVGLHAAALKDIEAAHAASNQPLEKDRPAWAPLIEAMCKYDFKVANEAAAKSDSQLAAIIAFMIIEQSGTIPMILSAAQRAEEVAPECYWLTDALVRFGGVGLKHHTTTFGPTVLQKTLGTRLGKMSGLPAAIKRELDDQGADDSPGIDPAWRAGAVRSTLVKTMITEGSSPKDRGEPSWETLGRLLEDVTFVHVSHRLLYFHDDLGLPRASYEDQLPAAYAVAAGHPYVTALKYMTVNPQEYRIEIEKALAKIDFVDADISCRALAYIGNFGAESPGQRLWSAILRHADEVAVELGQSAEITSRPGFSFYPRLQVVSPYSPIAATLMIVELGDFDQKRYDQLEQEFGQHPVVLRNLGARYMLFSKHEDAERVLKRCMEQCPDIKAHKLLAELYWKQKEYEKWKIAIDETLKDDDVGLGHADARVRIAKYLLENHRIEEAILYADAAASTGADWAMICAADVHEAAGNFQQAEDLIRGSSERYDDSRYRWLFWCRKTGHGDERTARNLATAQAKSLTGSASSADLDLLGDIYVMLDKKSLARRSYQLAFEAADRQYMLSGLQAVILADEADHNDARNVLLEQIQRTIPRNFPTHLGFAAWLKDAYARPLDAEPDDKAFEKLLQASHVDDQDRLIFRYCVARHYRHRGQMDLAREKLGLCLNSPYPSREMTAYAMAGALMRELPEKKAEGEQK